MEESKKAKLRSFFTKKVVIIAAVVLVVIIAAIAILNTKFVKNKLFGTKAVTQRTTKVERGNIDVTVTGSGPLTYTQTSIASTKVPGTITKLYFKEGDKVKAGDLIAEIDNKDAAQALQDKQNALTQTEISSSINQQTTADLSVKTPITGQVTNIVATVGTNINKGAAVLTVTDTSKLKLLIAFNSSDAAKIKLGQTADVYLNSLMQAAKGKVVYINNQADTTNAGGQLVKVEIDMANPGALLGGMTASADIETSQGTVSSAETGALEYVNNEVVTANATGTVEQVLVKDGQKVSSGSVVVQLKNDDIGKNNELASLKIQSSQSQLDLAQKQLDDYKIYASIDGSIITQTLNVGDNVKANDTIATITDTNQIQFAVPIDELDVAKVAVGQKVNVTVDALTDTATTPLIGVVDKVPLSGTSTNGVATFNVIVKLTAPNDKLKSGMNANAEIQISSVENALRVPIEAVTKIRGKNFVWVKGASSSTSNGFGKSGQGTNGSGSYGNSQNGSSSSSSSSSSSNKTAAAAMKAYYANAGMKQVEIGANNESYVEIKSGLNEGDTIILPQLQSSTSSTSSTQRQGAGGFGGMGGGGFVSGGNAGNNRNNGNNGNNGSNSSSSKNAGGNKN